MDSLPHLPGVPHLHVNRPLEKYPSYSIVNLKENLLVPAFLYSFKLALYETDT